MKPAPISRTPYSFSLAYLRDRSRIRFRKRRARIGGTHRMKLADLERRLRQHGCVLKRQGGNHPA